MRSKLILIAAAGLVLGGCNRHEADNQSQYTHLTGEEARVITPPAPTDYGPPPPDANAAAPGTNASLAFAEPPEAGSDRRPASRGGFTDDQHVETAAQDAAAKAPDTATADAEKRRVHEEFANSAAPGPDVVAAAPAATSLLTQEVPRQQ